MQCVACSTRVASAKVHRNQARSQISFRGRSVSRYCVVRASPENGNGPSQKEGTIFYGGKSYTDAEWKDAVEKGLVSATPATAGTSAYTNPALDSFVEAMAFSGPAPEVVNGRLAMIGFFTAAAAEIASGASVTQQWSEASGPIAATFGLFIAASLIPIFRGSKAEAFGPFTPSAEMLNGRAAMIGFAALLLVELVKGSSLL